MRRPSVVIVSPALATANNGNWQTARRYARLLRDDFQVRIVSQWDGSLDDEVLIALHARRSADSIQAWYAARGAKGLVVVLTGTDLYRDIQHDARAQHSLELAACLVVLQPTGLEELSANLRQKTSVLIQSTTTLKTLPKTARHVRAVMVGHLRPEKLPQTLFQAVQRLALHRDLYFKHIGGEHDPQLAQEAHRTASRYPQYVFMGARSHSETRKAIQRAHVLLHSSAMEGGAHVLMEAVCSGVPVIASFIPGNIGMLGADYSGFFPLGDAQTLANLLLKFKNDPSYALLLRTQCARRASLFSTEREQSGLITIVQDQL